MVRRNSILILLRRSSLEHLTDLQTRIVNAKYVHVEQVAHHVLHVVDRGCDLWDVMSEVWIPWEGCIRYHKGLSPSSQLKGLFDIHGKEITEHALDVEVILLILKVPRISLVDGIVRQGECGLFSTRVLRQFAVDRLIIQLGNVGMDNVIHA